MLVGNGCGYLGLETQKSAVSQVWIVEISWFFSCWYKFRKTKSFGKNLATRGKGQNALGQSDYRIFKSIISLEQSDEEAWFFACWHRFMEDKSWLKNVGVGMVKSGSGHSVLRTLKLALCQGKMNEINWFLVLIQIHES